MGDVSGQAFRIVVCWSGRIEYRSPPNNMRDERRCSLLRRRRQSVHPPSVVVGRCSVVIRESAHNGAEPIALTQHLIIVHDPLQIFPCIVLGAGLLRRGSVVTINDFCASFTSRLNLRG